MITNPISAKQVVDVDVDMKCLPALTCKTLPNVLQSIIDKTCEATPDFSTLDFKCVEPSTELLGTLQGIIDKLPCDESNPSPGDPDNPDASGYELTGLTTCSSDNWTCSESDACLEFTNPCTPGVITVKVVLQALIDREVAYGNVIKNLCSQIQAMQTQINTMQLQITTIQTSCCP